MTGLSKIQLLVQIMGDQVWDVRQLQLEYNKRRKRGICTRELSQKMRRNKEFEIVGNTSIIQGWVRNHPKPGYKLWAVSEEYRRPEL